MLHGKVNQILGNPAFDCGVFGIEFGVRKGQNPSMNSPRRPASKIIGPPGLEPPGAESLVASPKRVAMPDFGLVVSESRHAPGFSGRLRDDYSKFHLIIAGQAVWEHAGRTFSVGPDTLFHIPTGLPHSQRDLPHNPVILYFIHYKPALLTKNLRDRLAALGMLALDLSSPRINQASPIRSLYREMLFEQAAQQPGWQVLLLSALMSLAVRSLRMAEPGASLSPLRFRPGSDSAERVAQYALSLRSRFYHQPTLAEAARSVNLSERRFSDLFRGATGQSWSKYIQSLRLEHATKLLIETQKPIIAVAFESGFEDLSHFHHVFKATHGCSPLKYRKQRRQGAGPDSAK
jgi:AraC-like DNA-binding protein/mannose-6-phosphate isomerase-like protein (cupin superfamily)